MAENKTSELQWPSDELGPFQQAYMKVTRGNYHVQCLLTEFKSWVAQLKTELKVGGGNGEKASVTFNNVAPVLWYSTMLGDAVHNYRSSLDHLAVALVRIAEGNPKRTYFPFCNFKDDFEQVIQSRFSETGADCVALVRTLKPYKTPGLWNALRALHDLDITDKHHALIPALGSLERSYVTQEDNFDPPGVLTMSASDIRLDIYGGTLTLESPLLIIPDWKPPQFVTQIDLFFDPTGDLAGRRVFATMMEFSHEVTMILNAFFRLKFGD